MNFSPKIWFKEKGWKPFDFQISAWDAYAKGLDGLIQAPTGMGKTYAALFGTLANGKTTDTGLQILWITPLRALANDLAVAIRRPLDELQTAWSVDVRTGDTSSARRAKQKLNLPQVLITTPESLSLLLSYPEAAMQFAKLKTIVVDEWHELLGSKRGVLLELAIARTRTFSKNSRIWGLSATIGNLEQAKEVLTFTNNRGLESVLIRSMHTKDFQIDSIIPKNIVRFPWSGHLGLHLLPEVLTAVNNSTTTLLFTNTRSQAETWYQAIKEAQPELPTVLHHGSLDRKLREEAEFQIKNGSAKLAVCTSSLDLGVDFPPVDLVLQIGSPKGIARILQRLGRSGHTPNETSRMLCVPTNAFELLEYSAARRSCIAGNIESRIPISLALDILVQHILTSAITGFKDTELLAEVRSTYAFFKLTNEQWRWALEFAESGGAALRAYGEYQRLKCVDSEYHLANPSLARLQRMAIGTIVSDSMVNVSYLKGGNLGSIEESFIARLKPGDTFVFAGKLLKLIQLRGMQAYVRKATTSTATTVTRWMGGRLSLSTHLAEAVLAELTHHSDSPELKALEPILDLQANRSMVPNPEILLVETIKIQKSFHVCLYPFAGFKVHEGLAALISYRLSRKYPLTISSVVNDYGFVMHASNSFVLDHKTLLELLSSENLLEDILLSLNAAELGRRQFREISRIAGLVFQGYPGTMKSGKQLQVSSGLLYDVFRKYDPTNLLIEQADREVLEQELEYSRLDTCLKRLSKLDHQLIPLKKLTPFSFPLWASFTKTQVSSETWKDRIEKMLVDLNEK